MYEVELETPKGILKFNIKKITELDEHLLKHPDYTSVQVKRLTKERDR